MKYFLKIGLVVLLLDIFWLNYLLISKSPKTTSVPLPLPTPFPLPDFQTEIDLINTRLKQLEKPLETAPTSLPSPKFSNQSLSNSVTYVPIPGSGSVLSNTWTNLPGTEFYFNQSDFPKLKEAYFEANFNLLNGNGQAFLRLFDATNGIEIWGSEIKATGQQSVAVISPKITLRPGNNLLRVQAKSLTADTTVYHSGRLKLVIQN